MVRTKWPQNPKVIKSDKLCVTVKSGNLSCVNTLHIILAGNDNSHKKLQDSQDSRIKYSTTWIVRAPYCMFYQLVLHFLLEHISYLVTDINHLVREIS